MSTKKRETEGKLNSRVEVDSSSNVKETAEVPFIDTTDDLTTEKKRRIAEAGIAVKNGSAAACVERTHGKGKMIFPPELLRHIFTLREQDSGQQERRCTLVATVTLVCRRWYNALNSLLYEDGEINDSIQVVAFVQAIRENPHRADYLRKLEVVDDIPTWNEIQFDYFLYILETCTNIRSFVTRWSRDGGVFYEEEVIKNTVFLFLRGLSSCDDKEWIV